MTDSTQENRDENIVLSHKKKSSRQEMRALPDSSHQKKFSRREIRERRQHRRSRKETRKEEHVLESPWKLPDDAVKNIFSFLGPIDLGRVRATCSYWTKSGLYEGACNDALAEHRAKRYANTPRAVSLCLPELSLRLLDLPESLRNELERKNHPSARMVAPSLEHAIFAYKGRFEKINKQSLEQFRARRGCSFSRALLGNMMRQWSFRVVRTKDEEILKTVPVSDTDGCLLEGVFRRNLPSLLRAGDIVRIKLKRCFFDQNNLPVTIDPDTGDAEIDSGEGYYDQTEFIPFETETYVLVRIDKYQKNWGKNRKNGFFGTITSYLVTPEALRMILPGDRIWFLPSDVFQIPLALNGRLKTLRVQRRMATYLHYWSLRMSMLDKINYGLGPAPMKWAAKKATRLTNGQGGFIDKKAIDFLAPGCIVRALFRTHPDDECQAMGGCNCFTILAIDNEDPDFFYGEYFDNSGTQTVPDGIVLRMPIAAIFELPGWRTPEFRYVTEEYETNERLFITGPGQPDEKDLIDLGDPTDWKFSTPPKGL